MVAANEAASLESVGLPPGTVATIDLHPSGHASPLAYANASVVPEELHARNAWVIWRYIPDSDPQKKPAKVPFNPKTGQRASSTDPATWGSYDEANRALREGSYEGLGIVFNGDGISGVDLDDCFNPATGEIAPWAQDEIYSFETYTEFSPSDTGFHILFLSDFRHKGVKKGNIEIYSQGRFFTFTGRLYDEGLNTIEDCSKQHRQLHGEHAAAVPNAEQSPTVETDNSPLTDEDKTLCDTITDSKQGSKFTALFGGTWEKDNDYPSQSEADFALLSILTFWCRQDTRQIDRIFRASKLFRP